MVIGVGNELRGDDAVGCIVARRLSVKKLPGVVVNEIQDDCTILLDYFQQADNCLLIDAIVTGKQVGTICRVDLLRSTADKIPLTPSSHTFGILEAMAFAKLTNSLPKKSILFGMESINFEFGSEISKEIVSAIPQLIQQIEEELMNHEPD